MPDAQPCSPSSRAQPLVIIADDRASDRQIIADVLSLLDPPVRILEAETVPDLLQLARDQEVDLITLDISFSGADDRSREGLDVLPRLITVRPRVPIILVSGTLDLDRVAEAYKGNAPVQAHVDKGDRAFIEKLQKAARDAMEWGARQRRQADALYEAAEAAHLAGRAADAAHLFIEAFRTGDLAGIKRFAIKDRLRDLLPATVTMPDIQANLYRALVECCFDLNEEQELIAYARKLEALFPSHAAEAREYLAVSAEIGNRIYEMVAVRLKSAQSARDAGDFEKVLTECDFIRRRLSNVVEASRLRAEALLALGRDAEGIEACFDLAHLAIRNGELDLAAEVLETIVRVDVQGTWTWRVQQEEDAIRRIRDRIAEIAVLTSYPTLRVCGNLECQRAAVEGKGFVQMDHGLPPGECDICGVQYDAAPRLLRGRTVGVVGGRFGPKYREAITGLGAERVLHNDAIHDLGQIPGLVSASDMLIIVTGYASHAGTIMAEAEASRTGTPLTRVHFYGVRQVVRALVLDLLPRIAEAAELRS